MRSLIVVMVGLAVAVTAEAQAPRRGLDVLDYDLTLELPDTGAVIAGRAVLTVARTARLDTLRLDLVGLRVDSVEVNGAPTAFARDSAAIAAMLPPGSGDTLHVAVRYGGAPADGLIVRRSAAGAWTYFGDNFAQRARYWIPSVDVPADKATVTWRVSAPATHTVVANGVLVSRTPLDARGTRQQWVWRESHPISPYLMVIAAAPLAYVDLPCVEGAACVPQSAYAEAVDADFLPGPFARAPAIVDFFSRLVAPFPYEKLAHLESATRFGGMENATAIFYSDAAIHRRTIRAGVVAHETAHQWFGDAVTEHRFAELWLSEGFASYWEQLWVQHADGDSVFRAGLQQMRAEILVSPASAERPVIDSAESDYLRLLNTNSYQKGAWVLHMLRATLGDSAFFRGVRGYFLAHRHDTATSEDLRAALERASRRSLREFFDQWLHRPGWVELTTSWRYDRARRRVTLELMQGPHFAPFHVPLTVELYDADGRPHRATIQVAAERSQRVVIPIPLDAPPRSLVLDPDVELLASFATP